ncbi:MAG TPA: ABC transporter permease subunit [Thermofilum sp.]|nr:ABC transporter permease subunit [Thermofilum sp.]
MNKVNVIKKILPFTLILPSFLVMLFLYLYPFALSILKSFMDDQGRFTLKYYEEAFSSYKQDIFFSFWISLLSMFVSTFIAIILAAYLRLSNTPFKPIINSIYRFPLFIPMVVVAQMMRTFLAPHGLLNLMLLQMGLINIDYPPWFFDWKGMLIGFVWKQTPFMVLIILGGFQMIDDSLIEAARCVGANIFKMLVNIMLPLARASIAIAMILIFASNISTFTLPYMLIGGATPTTITVDIAHRVTYFGDWGTANALGVVSYLMVGAFAIYYLREVVRRSVYVQE